MKHLTLALAGLLLSTGLAQAAERLVTVGAPLTEIVYALGQEARLVGADTTSTVPAAAGDLPKVGYMRSLSAEGILSLTPDLLVVLDGSGPPAVLNQISAAGVRVITVAAGDTLEDIAEAVTTLAAELAVPEAGAAVLATMEADRLALDAVVRSLPHPYTPPTVLFALLGHGTPMGGGSNTPVDGLIRLAGGTNALAAIEEFKPLSPEAVIEAAPDIVLVTTGAVEAFGGLEGLAQHPMLAPTPAAQSGRIIPVDGTLLLGFGPRTPAAALDLARVFHDAKPQEEASR